MYLKLSITRKAGAPDYGSDGAGAELEIPLEGQVSPEQIVSYGQAWYATLELMVDRQLERMQAQHSQPRERPAERTPPAVAAPPRQAAPPEPAGQYGPPPRQAAPPRNGYDRGGNSDAPRTGAQLLGWANKHGCYQRLMDIADQVDRGPIKQWDQVLVKWAHQELEIAMQSPGQWGGPRGGPN